MGHRGSDALSQRPRGVAAVGGAAAGAAVTYLLDPVRGARRRALLRDRAVHVAHKAAHGAGATSRDVRNRTKGLAPRLRSRLERRPVDDDVLVARVRAQLGLAVRHPRSIDVSAHDGTVTLAGPVLRDEVNALRRAVQAVPGVRDVTDRLQVHERPGDVPGLQGGDAQPRRRRRPDPLQRHWSPTTRLGAGVAGAALARYGLRRRGRAGAALAAGGLAAVARAVTNRRAAELAGIGFRRNAVDVTKTITIAAPVERVFAVWDDLERLPEFMTNVRDVRRNADGSSHWEVRGPARTTVAWDAETTRREPNECLAWRSRPGSPVRHAGVVRFEPVDGGTRVTVRLTYDPLAGAAGHAVASLLGANPKAQLDEDLMRLKTLLETGVPSHDAARTQAGQRA